MQKNLILIVGIMCLALGAFSLFSESLPISTALVPTSTVTKTVSGRSVTVNPAVVWNDTGIQVNKGNSVAIQATGQVNVGSPGDGADKWVSPSGWGEIPAFFCNGKP